MSTQVKESEIVTIRPIEEIMTKQQLPNFLGVSQATAGSTGLSMNMVVIPPGGAGAPHYHEGFETAIYILRGRVKTLYGPGLTKEVINGVGDFMYIPPNVPHQPINMSDTEPAQAIIARNDSNEQESVMPYDPASAE